MFQYYEVIIEIKGYRAEKGNLIAQMLEGAWPGLATILESAELSPTYGWRMSRSATGYKMDDETEEDLAQRLAKLVWQGNESYCFVGIQLSCLEEIPAEVWDFGQDDYRKITAQIDRAGD